MEGECNHRLSLHFQKRLASSGQNSWHFSAALSALVSRWLCKRINTSRSCSNGHRHPVHSQVLLTMPIIPDGVYKIHNVKYSDPSQVADLVTGGPGPIDGITDWNAHNDKVRVVLCRGLYSLVQ